MTKYLYYLTLCLVLLASCDKNEDDSFVQPQSKPAENSGGSSNNNNNTNGNNNSNNSTDITDTNTNGNTGADGVATRMEMPHVDAAFLLVPHYVSYNGQRALNYTVQWNAGIRHSTWVAYSWDSTTASEDASVKRQDKFKWDIDVPRALGSVSSADYTKNGYDKGHICASEDRVFCQEANDQTFYYTNMSPQFSSFNQGFWKELEAKVRSWGRATIAGTYDTVYVVKGGTTERLLRGYSGKNPASDGVIPTTDDNGYSLRSDGKVGLPVPEYYYMALLSVKNGVYHAIAFIVPHSEYLPKTPKSEELQQYATTIDNLEVFTGIDFFCNLKDSKEKAVEKVFSLRDWSW